MALMSASGLQGITLRSSERYVSLDNSGVERKFFKDDFSNDTIAQYTIHGGSPSITGGELVCPSSSNIHLTKLLPGTAGKWDFVLQFTTTWAANQYAYCQIANMDYTNSYLLVTRKTGNAIWLNLTVDGTTIKASTNTGTTLADSTYGRASLIYDGVNWQMYWNDVSVGTLASGTITPNIGVGVNFDSTAGKIKEWVFVPSIAYTDLFAADSIARYMQLDSTDGTTFAASSAASVGGGVLTCASATKTHVVVQLRSYKFKSGEFEFSLKDRGAAGGGTRYLGGTFCVQDINNLYAILIHDQGEGSGQTLLFYKKVAGAWTALGAEIDIAATYTAGNKTWIKVHYDSERGQMWAYLRDDAGVYPTTPQVSNFSSQFSYGAIGLWSQINTVGAGRLAVDFDDFVVRANLLIGETNVPTTETGFYFRDEFTVDSIGRYLNSNPGAYSGTPAYTVSGGVLNISGTSGRPTGKYLPSKFSSADISVDVTTSANSGGRDYDLTVAWDGVMGNWTVLNGYSLYIIPRTTAGTGTISIMRVINGTSTNLVIINDQNIYPSSTYTLRLTWSSSGVLTGYLNGVQKVQATDTTFTNGYCGVEAVWVTGDTAYFDNLTISGTRYYMKPMLRGSQIGEYWNGTASVNATRFSDDANWNTAAEYSGDTLIIDTTNGHFYHSDASQTSWITNFSATNFVATISGYFPDGQPVYFDFWGKEYATGSSLLSGTHYTLQIYADSGGLTFKKVVSGTATTIGGTSGVFTGGIHTLSVVVIGTTMTATMDTGQTVSVTDTSIAPGGYFGFGRLRISEYISSYAINALESTSTNGVAVTIGGVPHGARFDTQEYAGFVFTNPLKGADAKLKVGSKCTLTANLCPITLEFKNATDNTSLSTLTDDLNRDLTVGSASDNKVRALDIEPLILDTPDIGDSLSLAVKRKNYALANDNQNAVFIDPKFVVLSQEG